MEQSEQNRERVGVLLFNLGGPEKLADVRPFLYNLFADPDIIRLPWRVMQRPLAWLISTQRYKKSRGYYEQIGGGSPLRRITDEQARALEASLGERGLDALVYVGMRYWEPYIEEALAQIERDGINRLVVLPLYPQYSISTTGSSLNKMNSLLSQNGRGELRIAVIKNWHDDPGYVAALARTVSEELAQFPNPDPASTHIVFSAHSVPVSYIEAGDPYLDQIKETVRLVMEELGGKSEHSLSFQSKVGPVKWLQPSTDEMLRRLAREKVIQVLLVPVSFVSEHIETLYELDILYRGVANEVGLAHYRRAPALNCRRDFIDALAGLVQNAL
jgi:protoporphyrin/coproporphyrin ferrochelatase